MQRASFHFWGTSIILSAVSSAGVALAQPAPAGADKPAAPPAEEVERSETDAAAEPAQPAPTAPAAETTPASPETTPAPETGAAEGSAETAAAPVEAAGTGSLTQETSLFPSPEADAASLAAQGTERPGAAKGAGTDAMAAPGRFGTPSEIFAEDWWTHARPIIELHGYLRTRAELFHNFSLGRVDPPNTALWPQPSDHRYTPRGGSEIGPELCTREESDSGGQGSLVGCDNNTQSGANLRLRLSPEIHVSDNVRVFTQMDLLDNLVLGSTPEGYRFAAGEDGQELITRSGYYPLSFYDSNQAAPSSNGNSLSDSIVVKRAWGEYTTPVGEIRFGRMPDHFGLGMLYNAGDGHDDDYQSTVDRLMFTTGFKALDLVVGASWEFPSEGAVGTLPLPGAQPYDRANLDDVDQWSFLILRRKSAQLEKLALSRGDVLLSGGLYAKYRTQTLANDQSGGAQSEAIPTQDLEELAQGFARRDAEAFIPDLWFQIQYKKFRFELETAMVLGSIESTETGDNAVLFETGTTEKLKLAQVGLATELEQKFVEDRLRLKFNFGWASGDADAFDDSVPGDLVPGPNQTQVNDDTDSTFRFHPGYRVDMILNRHILNRIQGTYYFSPGLEYDFVRDPDGQRAGGGVRAVWTRASEFVQTPGHTRDLGIELNGTLYFQAKDGALNDTPDSMGGFYTALQYGVVFPLDGMGYLPGERDDIIGKADTSAAQILRWYLGVMF